MSVCLCECVFVIKIRLQKISSSANPTADRVSELSSWCQESFIGIIKKAYSVQIRAWTRNESSSARTVEHNEASVLLTQSVIPKRDLFFFWILPVRLGRGCQSANFGQKAVPKDVNFRKISLFIVLWSFQHHDPLPPGWRGVGPPRKCHLPLTLLKIVVDSAPNRLFHNLTGPGADLHFGFL